MSFCHNQSLCTAIFPQVGDFEKAVDGHLGTKNSSLLAILQTDQGVIFPSRALHWFRAQEGNSHLSWHRWTGLLLSTDIFPILGSTLRWWGICVALFYSASLLFLIFISVPKSEHLGSPPRLSKLQSLKSFFHKFSPSVLDFPSCASQFQVAGSHWTYHGRTFFSCWFLIISLNYKSKLIFSL